MHRCRKASWPPVVLSAALLLAAAGPARAQEEKTAKAPEIDVVICLDVSSSMQGLFGSAKLKLWDIVNDLGKVEPTPNLRVGLYSYGHGSYDDRAGWVRKEIDLTTDLDEVYRKLHGLTVRGNEVYVTRVCRDALRDQKWSEDKSALRVLFVCGNQPAAQDPKVPLREVVELAAKKDVVINAIFCGPPKHKDAADWQKLALMTKGHFASIDQNRGTTGTVTPHDKEIAALSVKLNATYVPYGKDGHERALNQKAQDDNAYRTSPEAAASRGVAKSGNLYRCDGWDLVDRLKNDPKFDVKTVPEEDLPGELRKMKPAERERYVREMLDKREALQKQIVELNQKREEFLRDALKKNPSKADRVFDEAVRGSLREQAAAKGIKVPE
jgi:hypothetical protein